MNKVHSPINWENYPSEKTPINEENLNKMDNAIGVIDDRVVEHENKKATKEEVASVISDVEYNVNNSVFKFTRKNGDAITVDIANVSAKEAYTREESDEKYVDVEKYNDEIESLTNEKVSYADIVDHLESDNPNLPLSANQGRVLKTALDFIEKAYCKAAGGVDFTSNTIAEFVERLNSMPERMTIGRFKLPSSYAPTGVSGWVHGFMMLQNAPYGSNSVDGTIFVSKDGSVFLGKIHGQTEFSIAWTNLTKQKVSLVSYDQNITAVETRTYKLGGMAFIDGYITTKAKISANSNFLNFGISNERTYFWLHNENGTGQYAKITNGYVSCPLAELPAGTYYFNFQVGLS